MQEVNSSRMYMWKDFSRVFLKADPVKKKVGANSLSDSSSSPCFCPSFPGVHPRIAKGFVNTLSARNGTGT